MGRRFDRDDRFGIFTDADDIDIERLEWNPTPEQMQRYLAREAEHAKANLALLRERSREPRHDRAGNLFFLFTSAETTHSRRALWAAQQGLKPA